MNIVLDMDQTLIDGQILSSDPSSSRVNVKIVVRPHLSFFLTWCFKNFTSVSIWTAATKSWWECVYENVLKSMLETISRELNQKCEFDFVFTQTKCNRVHTFSACSNCTVMHIEKRLRKLHRYKSPAFQKYDINNTIIIDDNASTYSQNYGNAILIPPFNMFNPYKENDTALLQLAVYFDKFLLPYYEFHRTVRTLEKRDWQKQVYDLVKQEAIRAIGNTNDNNCEGNDET